MTNQTPPSPQPPNNDPWESHQQPPPPGGNPYGAPPYGWGTAPPTGDPYAAPQYGPRPPSAAGDPYGAPQYGPAPPPPPYSPFASPPQFDATRPPSSPAAAAGLQALAIISLVFGAVSIVGSLLIFFRVGAGFYIGSIAGIVGLTLGIVAHIRARSGLSLAGLTVSAIAFAIAILLLITSLVIHH